MAASIDVDLVGKFEKAASYLEAIARTLSSEQLLELYGLYKQATCGPCDIPKPYWFNKSAARKYDAWMNVGKLSKYQAMENYVSLVTSHDPLWEAKVAADYDAAFSGKGWVTVSCPIVESEPELRDEEKSLLDWAKEGKVDKVGQVVRVEDINQWDEEGMTALHWASDRGNVEMVERLIALGADVNIQDSEGQTALHFAASCGHQLAVASLLKAKANTLLTDREGDTPVDVAISQEIVELIRNVHLD